jgi:N-acetylglucosaminyldiphosphoundecaprenol N-acetyl-beta-D-mannosaminyltransferase
MEPVTTFHAEAGRQDVSSIESVRSERVNVLGVGVSAITMTDALTLIDRWIATRANQYVCVTGVHGVMESQADPRLRDIHNRAGLVTPDGMPLVWISWLRGHRQVEWV